MQESQITARDGPRLDRTAGEIPARGFVGAPTLQMSRVPTYCSFVTRTHAMEGSGMGSRDRPEHTPNASVVPCNPGCDVCCFQSLLLPALRPVPWIWMPEDICYRQNSMLLKKKNRCCKINSYSSTSPESTLSALSALSTSRSC